MDEPIRNDLLKSGGRLKQEIKCSRIIDFIRILYTVHDSVMAYQHNGCSVRKKKKGKLK